MSSSGPDWSNTDRIAVRQRYARQAAAMGSAATELLMQAAAVSPGMRVLDVATGMGEPAILLGPRVMPGGKVLGIDPAGPALEVALHRAEKRQSTNVTFQQADVHHLPFPESVFNVVTSRLGVMFFSDMPQALDEIRRVLKPGGNVALLAWGAMKDQDYLGGMIEAVLSELPWASLPPEGAMAFKFAEPGSLSAALRRASFRDVREELREVPWVWPGPPEEVWEYAQVALAPLQSLFASIPPDRKPQVDTKVLAAIRRHYDGKWVNFRSKFVLVTAVK